MAACVALATAVAALVLYQQAERGATAARDAAARHLKAAVAQTMRAGVGRLQELASAAGEHWPRGNYEFTTLADGVLQNEAVERVSLIRYLTAGEREGYERQHGPIQSAPAMPPPAQLGPKGAASRLPAGGTRGTAGATRHRPAGATRQGPADAPPAGPPPPPPSSQAAASAAIVLAPPPPPTRIAVAKTRRASAKARYFVLESFVARTQEAVPIDVNVGAVHARAVAMLTAASSGTPQATAPIQTASATSAQSRHGKSKPEAGRRGLATELYVPVYRSGAEGRTGPQRLKALLGFIATRYRYAMLGASLSYLMPEDIDYSLEEGGRTLLARGSPAGAKKVAMPVAGRTWTLTVGAPSASLALVIDTLLAGAALTILLAMVSRTVSRHERDALDLVQRRVAERELAESALATAEKRFRTAFAEAPIGMALVSLGGRLTQVNRALARIAGYPEEQLLAAPAVQFFHPDDRALQEAAVAEMRDGQLRVHDAERRLLTADGESAWVSVHTTLIRDEQEQPAYFLAQIEDITERRRYETRLHHMADHDPLTALLNRRAYDRVLQQHLDSAAGREGHGGVLVLDLDDFKQVNDTLGHSAGDDLIARVATALTARLRSEDVIARLGGDEFAILVRSGGRVELEQLAESLLETVRNQRAARGPGGRERPVTASLGVAPLCTLAGSSADEVLTAADLAMYDAKEAGRDRAETYGGEASDGEGRQARIETHLAWVERIRAALDEQDLVLHAQPVAETSTGRMTQYELLLRMRDSDGSLIPPGRFLPVAERYGLIKELDRWVIGAAIEMLGEHLAEGRRPIVELNLSGQSLSDPDLAEHVGRRLQGSEVDPTQLIFEVTETAAIGNMAAARKCAEQLHELGCRFALDDFGAGFGSFYYLKHLPFDYIKIDGEFVRNCTKSTTDRLVVKAVVDLARGMNKRTIAEFVGDADTVRVLGDLGVDYAQGFYIGKPAPLADWLACAEDGAARPDVEAP